MHAGNSEEMQHSTSQQDSCSVQLSSFLRSSLEITECGKDADDHQAPSQFDVPGDGSCLFWAATLAYLIPVVDDDALFQLRYEDLFGEDETVATKITCVKTSISYYNPLSHSVPKDDVLESLVRSTFRNRVVDFMESNLERFECFSEVADEQYRLSMRNPDTWSGDPEIQAISLMLNCRINVDGQTFPVISNNEEVTHDPKIIMLRLFHVNRSTGDAHNANHYNYGLEKGLLDYFREILINNVLELVENYSSENPNTGMQNQYAGLEYKSSDNSKKRGTTLENVNYEDITDVIDTKIICRINNEVKLNALCMHKLLQDYKADFQENQPVKEDNARMICSLFQIPKHVAGIFGILKNMPEESELLKRAFKVVNIIIDELYNNGYYDLVLLIVNVKEVDSIKKVFLQSDSCLIDVLQFQRIVAQTKNKKGLHEDALEILCSIADKIINVKCRNASDETSIENIDCDKFCFSSLISSDIAYTKHLMGKCEESCSEYKALHENIMKHLGINSDASILSYKMYAYILQSDKYKRILALHPKYLDILHIRACIAQELICLGDKNRNNLREEGFKDYSEAFYKSVECYRYAINLCQDNFRIRRVDAEFHHDVGKNVYNIAVVYTRLGDLNLHFLKKIGQNLTISSLDKALNYYFKAVEMHCVNLTVPNLGATHPVNSKFVRDITWILNNIASIHKKCANFKFHIDSKAALQHLENSLNICESLYKLQVNKLGKEHKSILSKLEDIAFINTKLGHLKSRYYQYNPEEASRNYKQAYKINNELLEIKRRTLGDTHPDTLRIEAYVNKTKNWIDDVI